MENLNMNNLINVDVADRERHDIQNVTLWRNVLNPYEFKEPIDTTSTSLTTMNDIEQSLYRSKMDYNQNMRQNHEFAARIDKQYEGQLQNYEDKIEQLQEQYDEQEFKENWQLFKSKPKSKENDIVGVYKLKDKLEAMYVSGIKGITQVLPVKRDDEFVVVTAGTNLKDVLKYEGVDIFNTVTNDFYEIEKLFGIEAARQSIINEMKQVVESQGLDVDIRHIMLVADIMTVGGTVKGVTRYGVVSEKSSVLARASFETPIKHLINAALVGEDDKLTSIVENVMLNQPIPVGTGLPGLKMKP